MIKNKSVIHNGNEICINKQVFVYTEPKNSTRPETSPIWQGKVENIVMLNTAEASYLTKDIKETVDITITIDTGCHSRKYPADRIFTNLGVAKEFARKELEKLKSSLVKERLQQDSDIVQALIEIEAQVVEDF